MQDKEYLNVKEVAELFRVSKSQIYNLVKEEKINFLKIGASIRFDKEEITSKFKERNLQDATL